VPGVPTYEGEREEDEQIQDETIVSAFKYFLCVDSTQIP
jgi:hypothetical protein